MIEDPERAGTRSRNRLLALILGIAAASLAYRIATATGLEHTAFVFVGVPTLLAVAVAFTPQSGTARGTILRATTLALLIAGIAFGEAFVCILFAAPLIYLVAGGIGTYVDWSAKKRREGRAGFAHAPVLALAVLAVPALEGVVPRFEFPREAQVTRVRIVPASPVEVERALAAPMRFDP